MMHEIAFPSTVTLFADFMQERRFISPFFSQNGAECGGDRDRVHVFAVNFCCRPLSS